MKLFTKDENLRNMVNTTIWIILIAHGQNFFQAVLCGTIRALAQQNRVATVNIITYQLITLPLAYYFVFVMDLGIKGIWFAFVCGLTH